MFDGQSAFPEQELVGAITRGVIKQLKVKLNKKGIQAMYCNKCGSYNSNESRYCSSCGVELTPTSDWTRKDHDLQGQNRCSVLETWKVHSGMGILGIICWAMLDRVGCAMIDSKNEQTAFYGLAIALVYYIFKFIYLLGTFPSFFTTQPKLTGNAKISFLNYFFGGPIFGWCFQKNLDKKKKGVSHIVCLVVVILYAVCPVL